MALKGWDGGPSKVSGKFTGTSARQHKKENSETSLKILLAQSQKDTHSPLSLREQSLQFQSVRLWGGAPLLHRSVQVDAR